MPGAMLEAAFKATIYRVEVSEDHFDLRIGEVNRDFDDWLQVQGVNCWGILTACNPGAQRISDRENRLRQTQLQGQLQRLAWHFFPACNLDSQGVWPPEPGFLILQIDQVCLCTLARQFLQTAVVWGGVGLPARLLWIERDVGKKV